MRLTEKQSLFSKYMFTIGSDTFGNGTESARKAGYEGEENVLAATASRLLRNVKIISEKQRIQAETVEKLDLSREYCTQKLQDIVENGASERNRLTAISLLGDLCGFKRENAPNREAERAKLERMGAAERAYRLSWEQEQVRRKSIKVLKKRA